MKMADILQAEREAERFLGRVQDFRDVLADDDHKKKYWSIIGCPESAALRRASMDLTRSLAKMRAR